MGEGDLRLVIEGPHGARVERRLAAGERLVLGRGAEADQALGDEGASRRHVLVELDETGWRVTDLGSRNGTLLDGAPLTPYEPREVPRGGELRVGEARVLLEPPRGPTLPPELAPQVRERFVPLRELGRGAVGVVHAARELSSGRLVAIKQLDASAATPTQRERFLREAHLQLASPHVVALHEVRVEGPRVFLIMELLEGGSLEGLLEGGPLPVARALEIAEQVARGLADAHTKGVIHRDVKPANVLLSAEGAAKLTDFGIARDLESVLTNTGQGLGTLAYVAPEQAVDAKRAGPAADLYALGATLYHMLAGRPPLEVRNHAALERILHEEPPALRDLRPDCPPPVASLVHRLLEKEPVDRLPSADALARKLASLR